VPERGWISLTACSEPVSLVAVVGGTVGFLLLIGLGLIAAGVVLVNLNDLRRWQQYEAWKAENERRLAEHSNPLYKEKGRQETTVMNPAFEGR